MTPEDEKKAEAGQKGAGERARNRSRGRFKSPFGTHTPLPGWAEFLGEDEAKENGPDRLPTRRAD